MFSTSFFLYLFSSKPFNEKEGYNILSLHSFDFTLRSRGGDGFAFVIQHQHQLAMGNYGSGIGFDGILQAMAIEFDTK